MMLDTDLSFSDMNYMARVLHRSGRLTLLEGEEPGRGISQVRADFLSRIFDVGASHMDEGWADKIELEFPLRDRTGRWRQSPKIK
ncbi:hypothetical protein HNR05_001413 [Leifsonia psychrotolerans]|uniref:Uncharacterized protein n=1 Tax=Glaciibacter psychrotolerans TaxID=670054 RepID=A0A7Z0EET1_9MICO|nr:hypothetical protein [Leifsonia psychrotolerans]